MKKEAFREHLISITSLYFRYTLIGDGGEWMNVKRVATIVDWWN